MKLKKKEQVITALCENISFAAGFTDLCRKQAKTEEAVTDEPQASVSQLSCDTYSVLLAFRNRTKIKLRTKEIEKEGGKNEFSGKYHDEEPKIGCSKYGKWYYGSSVRVDHNEKK